MRNVVRVTVEAVAGLGIVWLMRLLGCFPAPRIQGVPEIGPRTEGEGELSDTPPEDGGADA